MAEKTISHDPGRGRYELRLDGRLVGEADYRRDGKELAFTHTGVEPALRGQGLAGELIEAALREALEAGDEVLPYCSYVADYIERHPRYRELVPPDRRRAFGISEG